MTLLNKIKQLFETETATPVEVKFLDVKTQDGSLLLRITGDVAIDSAVQVITEDGSLNDIENGDYVLEDGKTISVLDGKIAGVTETAEEAEAEAEGEMAVETELAAPATEEAPATENAGDLETRLAACEAKLAEVIDLCNKMAGNMNELSTEKEELLKKNEVLSAKAAAPSVLFKKFEKEPEAVKAGSMLDKVMKAKNN